MRLLVAVVLVSVAISLAGCSDGLHELFVDVRSDLAPELEFDELVIELLDERGRAGDVVRRAETAVLASHDFVAGRRVAEWGDLETGTYYARVEVRLDGAAIVDLLAEISLSSDRAVTIFVSRGCLGVACPAVGGDPRATSCVAAQCVVPACLLVGTAGCPVPGDGGWLDASGTDAGSDAAVVDASGADGAVPDGGAIDPDLVAWYRFEASGSFGVSDASGRGIDATCLPLQCGSVVPGVVGNAWELDGIDDHAVTLSKRQLDLAELTVVAWVRSAALDPMELRMIAGIPYGAAYANSWELYFVDWEMDGTVDTHFAIADMALEDRAGTLAPPALSWTFVAGTFDGASIRIYVDGVPRGEHAHTSPTTYDGQPLYIGADFNEGAAGSFWNGAIDELRIYGRVLDVMEIDEIYERERP